MKKVFIEAALLPAAIGLISYGVHTTEAIYGLMGVIEAVINNRSFQRRHLDSLYEQLKKLREE